MVERGNGNGMAAINYQSNPFETVVKTSNNLFFNIATDEQFIGFDYLNKSGKDIYNQERSDFNELSVDYHHTPDDDLIQWKVQLKHIKSNENQPNINGFQNNLFLNALVTPASFNNDQGSLLPNGGHRSFSSERINNPRWLLNTNRNQVINDLWLAALRNQFYISDAVSLKTKFSYSQNSKHQKFGLLPNTLGHLNGYSSDKMIAKDVFNANISIDWDQYFYGSDLTLVSSFDYNNENLEYQLSESIGLNENSFNKPQNTLTHNHDLSRATLRWYTRVDFRFLNDRARVSFINNSFTSTKQNTKWFLPTLQLKYQFAHLFDSNFLRRLNLSTSLGKDINHLNLFYHNQSHNSLRFNAEQSFGYTANNDLFATNAIDLEDKTSYELNLDLALNIFDHYWSLNTTYYSNTINGSVFPVWRNNRYQLQNIADIQNSGVEWSLDGGIYDYNGIRFTPRIIFSKYSTKVLDLLTDDMAIPIAGFSTISKNLIKGQPAGVLLGSAYARDLYNAYILDSNRFPVLSSDLEIIGNPIPDFNLGFSSTLQWKGFQFDFLIDYQKGGDIWNGTQHVLNYFGTSQQSAIERENDSSVFDRYQHYGFEGVAEDAIVDGSYLNFKSVQLSYETSSDNNEPFFRQFKIGIYGTNLFTVSKYRGASPYSSLFDQTSSQGLNFFNSPIIERDRDENQYKKFKGMKTTVKVIRKIALSIILGLLLVSFNRDEPKLDLTEKIYTHTDRSLYFPNETIWFKAYVVNASNTISALSEMMYADLISPKGSVVKTLRLPVQNGYSYGNFSINKNWVGGIYTLKVYTNWMRNYGEEQFFTKKITVQKVVQPNLLMKLKFEKEGYGKSSEVTANFEVKDLKNNPLASTEVNLALMIDGKSYLKLNLRTDANGELSHKFKLPDTLKTSDVLVNMLIPYKGSTESISRSVPVVLDNLDVQFFPESGKNHYWYSK